MTSQELPCSHYFLGSELFSTLVYKNNPGFSICLDTRYFKFMCAETTVTKVFLLDHRKQPGSLMRLLSMFCLYRMLTACRGATVSEEPLNLVNHSQSSRIPGLHCAAL